MWISVGRVLAMDSGVEGKRATHTEEDTGGDEGDQPPKMPKTAEAGELKVGHARVASCATFALAHAPRSPSSHTRG